MKCAGLAAGLFVASLLGCAAPPRERIIEALPKIENDLEAALASYRLPNLAVGVVFDGKIVWSGGFGFRDVAKTQTVGADSVFRIASVTKVLTGLAVLMLRDEGKLTLDDPVARWIPEIRGVVAPTKDAATMTLRHLLTHTSGLPHALKSWKGAQAAAATEADLLAGLSGMRLKFGPGTKDAYSNVAYALLGLVVSRAAKEAYPEFVSRRFLGPLGMTQTVWNENDVAREKLAACYRRESGDLRPCGRHWDFGAAAAMGGLYSTVDDLAKLVAFELAAWPARDGAETGPVRRATVRESHLSSGAFGDGIGWRDRWYDKREGNVVAMSGATRGYSARVRLLPMHKLGVIVLTSVMGQNALEEIATLVCRRFLR